MPEAAVGEGKVVDAEKLRLTGQADGGFLTEGQFAHGFLYGGRHHLLGGRVHGSDVTVYVTLYNAHGRGVDKQTQKGVLLLQRKVFAAQANQQVVKGLYNDIRFGLTGHCQSGCQVQIFHQFHAADECIVRTECLLIEEPQIKE